MSNIEGIEVIIDWSVSWDWTATLIGFLVVSAIFVISIMVYEKGFRIHIMDFIMSLVVGSILGFFVGVAGTLVGMTNSSGQAYDNGINDIESHYGVSLLNEENNEIDGREVFNNNSASNFTPVVIENGLSRIDGYVLNIEDDTYALVVEEGAETSSEFVEYGTELVNSDSEIVELTDSE